MLHAVDGHGGERSQTENQAKDDADSAGADSAKKSADQNANENRQIADNQQSQILFHLNFSHRLSPAESAAAR